MSKKVKTVIVAGIAVLFCGGASACGEFFDVIKDVKVTVTEWNKAFEFDYTHYQIDASFVPENVEQETQKVKLEKDGDVMCLQLAEGDEEYNYSVYAARIGNDYKKYAQDEAGAWNTTKLTKESYNEFHASAIMKNLLGKISYSNFLYSETDAAYSYTQALPTGENVATYSLEFLDNKIVEMHIEIGTAPITFTCMGMDVELGTGTLTCTFTYEDKDLLLPTIGSSNEAGEQVTAEEWYEAVTLYDEENVQVEVMQNNVRVGQFVKDGDIVYGVSVEGEELYLQINEDGETLKEYYKDETGAWVLNDYQNTDLKAPGSGLGLYFNLLGSNADIYSYFTYDTEEGVYAYTTNAPFMGLSGSSTDTDNESDNESNVTTTITARFENKKLVEITIKQETTTETTTEIYEIALKYTYYVQKLTLPSMLEQDDKNLTEAEWEEALNLLAFENFRVATTTSDGLPVTIEKDGNVVRISLNIDADKQEIYLEKEGDNYKKYILSETGTWREEDCTPAEYESYLPLNLNESFDYAEFTYVNDGEYSRTITIGESQTQTTILCFEDKKLVEIRDETKIIFYVEYGGVELIS